MITVALVRLLNGLSSDEVSAVLAGLWAAVAAVIGAIGLGVAAWIKTRAALHDEWSPNGYAATDDKNKSARDMLDVIQQTQRAQHDEMKAITARQDTQIEQIQDRGEIAAKHLTREIAETRSDVAHTQDTIRYYHPRG
jgi:polyhydroxyalkanoate synthesis regulator phasin